MFSVNEPHQEPRSLPGIDGAVRQGCLPFTFRIVAVVALTLTLALIAARYITSEISSRRHASTLLENLKERGAYWSPVTTDLASIRYLHFRFDTTTDDDLREACRLPMLEGVALNHQSNRFVTDQSLRHLATLPALRALQLPGTSITNQGLLDYVRRSPQLEYLEIENGLITEEAVEMIRTNFPKCRVVWRVANSNSNQELDE